MSAMRDERIMDRTVERVEGIGRVVAVIVGVFTLSLTVIGPHSAWGLLGAVPLAMGWSGW